jgi:hypothetical protein
MSTSYPLSYLIAPHDLILTTTLSNAYKLRKSSLHTSLHYFLFLSSNNAVIKKLVCHNPA